MAGEGDVLWKNGWWGRKGKPEVMKEASRDELEHW